MWLGDVQSHFIPGPRERGRWKAKPPLVIGLGAAARFQPGHDDSGFVNPLAILTKVEDLAVNLAPCLSQGGVRLRNKKQKQRRT
jgi:hypothetical protein